MKYKATVKFIFEGTVDIIADNKVQAKEHLENHFGCVLTGHNPHTTLSDDEIPDWDFCVHPVNKIIKIRKA